MPSTINQKVPSQLMPGLLQVTAKQAKKLIKRQYRMLLASLVEGRPIKCNAVYLHGDPATAKSSIIEQISLELNKEFNFVDSLTFDEIEELDEDEFRVFLPDTTKADLLKSKLAVSTFPELIVFKSWYADLTSKEAVDFRGLPVVENGITGWATPNDLPTANSFGLFVGDEFTRSQEGTRAPFTSLLTEHRIGSYTLSRGVMVILAANDEDKGVVPASIALNTRVLHLYVRADLPTWHEWALDNGIHPLTQMFLKMKPHHFHQFDTKSHTQPNGRTWHMMSDWTWELEDETDRNDVLAIFQGLVGYTIACEYEGFIRMNLNCVDPDSILLCPDTEEVPENPSILYATVMALGRKATQGNFQAVMTYLNRCPIEFRVAAVKAIRDHENRQLKEEIARLGKNPQPAQVSEVQTAAAKRSINMTQAFNKFVLVHQGVLAS